MQAMTQERGERLLADYHLMISRYAQRTPDPKVREAGIHSINAQLVRNLRDAGYSRETIIALMTEMAQITALTLACPELEWETRPSGGTQNVG